MLPKKLVAALVEKRVEKRERKRAFLENGGLVLERLVASCNGRPIPIRTFSYKELLLATNNFDPRLILRDEGHHQIYKGSFEGRVLSIKKYDHVYMDEVLTDLGISAKTSAHKHILQLAGCCLETSIPALVFEYAQNGVLADQIFCNSQHAVSRLQSRQKGMPLVWQSRLKIVRQIAHAISYVHTAFSRSIIHRDIKLSNIFLDEHDVPKLANFELSISIPEGETYVDVAIQGTYGYACPSYVATGRITEKADVYSFGVVMLEILTGRPVFDKNRATRDHNLLELVRNCAINEIVDPAILAEDGGVGLEESQLQAVLRLALICIENDPEIRPTMVNVTKELRRIERSIG
ncbi:serine/threonine-protein kinase ZRK1-like [Corylus avellana]|uniref:serine/threonine-protein kinase ZRK1-like n=1 Tax=Corylus avellana TaxID=13451 RepID=UPI001E238BCE|nr:serine/threonine-protein kinase ZRK1-like [Corylus avellana]